MLLIPRCRVSSVRKRRKITWNHHPRLSFQLEISRENTDLTKIWGRERRKKRRVGKEFDRYSISFFFFFHGIDESSWAGIDGEAQKDREKCREPFFFFILCFIFCIFDCDSGIDVRIEWLKLGCLCRDDGLNRDFFLTRGSQN